LSKNCKIWEGEDRSQQSPRKYTPKSSRRHAMYPPPGHSPPTSAT
jgi:hypothetical protein